MYRPHRKFRRNTVMLLLLLSTGHCLAHDCNDQLLVVFSKCCGNYFEYIIFRFLQSRALSLRNLVLGYECERVFSAGVGLGSPSTDTANCLSLRLGRSVETRRRYGWLRMVFPGECLFRAPIWCPSGSGSTREARKLSQRAW